MKTYIEFENITYKFHPKGIQKDFKGFMTILAKFLMLDVSQIRITFDRSTYIDSNYNWPLFRDSFFDQETIGVKYIDDLNANQLPTTDFITKLKTSIYNIINSTVRSSHRQKIVCLDTNIEGGDIEFRFRMDGSPFSADIFFIHFTARILQQNLYFNIKMFDANYKSLQYPKSFGKINKITPNFDSFAVEFSADLKRILMKYYQFNGSAFLMTSFNMKCKIFQYLSPVDYVNLCFTTKSMHKLINSPYVWSYYYLTTIKKLPKTGDPYKELSEIYKKLQMTRNRESPPYIIRPSLFMEERFTPPSRPRYHPQYIPGMIGGYHDMMPFVDPPQFNPLPRFSRPPRFERFPRPDTQPEEYFPNPIFPPLFDPNRFDPFDNC